MNIECTCIQQFIDNQLVHLPMLEIDGKLTGIKGVIPVATKQKAIAIADIHREKFTKDNQVNIPFSQLTKKQAKAWLLTHDPDGAELWLESNDKEFYVSNVEESLRSYGLKNQSGVVIITRNNDHFINCYHQG